MNQQSNSLVLIKKVLDLDKNSWLELLQEQLDQLQEILSMF